MTIRYNEFIFVTNEIYIFSYDKFLFVTVPPESLQVSYPDEVKSVLNDLRVTNRENSMTIYDS